MMLAMKKEAIVSIADIETLCVTCPTCTSQIRLTMSRKISGAQDAPSSLVSCPSCGTGFGSALPERLENLRLALYGMSGTAPYISIQIKGDNF